MAKKILLSGYLTIMFLQNRPDELGLVKQFVNVFFSSL